MEELRVRVYNVGFGDAIFVSVPDSDDSGSAVMRHILIDAGNAFGGEGGDNEVFSPVFENILEVLNGQALDLYVMTHEHLDHVQGPLYANLEVVGDNDLTGRLNVRHAWLTASSEPGYYKTHNEARKRLVEAEEAYYDLERYLMASSEVMETVKGVMAINNPQSTKDCVDFIRSLAQHTWYVHRELPIADKHPFRKAEFEIWAPEEDTSTYYGRFLPLQFGVLSDRVPGQEDPSPGHIVPPPGVDAGAFYDLLAIRGSGFLENLFAIDKARNNTSLVFCLKWSGWSLLFTGDAEIRSWREMNKRSLLEPVDFLKVSHHGSHNGTPPIDILKQLLPAEHVRLAATEIF